MALGGVALASPRSQNDRAHPAQAHCTPAISLIISLAI
jgi:hypothetical protein